MAEDEGVPGGGAAASSPNDAARAVLSAIILILNTGMVLYLLAWLLLELLDNHRRKLDQDMSQRVSWAELRGWWRAAVLAPLQRWAGEWLWLEAQGRAEGKVGKGPNHPAGNSRPRSASTTGLLHSDAVGPSPDVSLSLPGTTPKASAHHPCVGAATAASATKGKGGADRAGPRAAAAATATTSMPFWGLAGAQLVAPAPALAATGTTPRDDVRRSGKRRPTRDQQTTPGLPL